LLLSLSYKSIFLLIIISFSLFLATVYCIWLYNRMCFGVLKKNYIKKYKDLTLLEFLILIIFTLLILFFGVYPNCILNLFHDIVYYNVNTSVLFINNKI
jgi:NADH-quinone oxidoreductase subunit M